MGRWGGFVGREPVAPGAVSRCRRDQGVGCSVRSASLQTHGRQGEGSTLRNASLPVPAYRRLVDQAESAISLAPEQQGVVCEASSVRLPAKGTHELEEGVLFGFEFILLIQVVALELGVGSSERGKKSNGEKVVDLHRLSMDGSLRRRGDELMRTIVMGCSVRWRAGCLTCFGEFFEWFKGGSMKQSRLQIPVRPYCDDCWIELSF